MMKKAIPAFLVLVIAAGFLPAQTDEWTLFRSPETVNDYVDRGEYFWLAIGNGVSRLQKDDLSYEFWSPENSNIPAAHIQAIAINQAGTAWIGTYDGEIARLVNDEWEHIPVPEEVIGDTPQDRLYALRFDDQDHLWVGTHTGLHRFDGEEWTSWNQANTGEPITDVWAIACGADGKVYFVSSLIYELDGDVVTDLSQNDFHLVAYGEAYLEMMGEELWYCSPGVSFARYAGGEWTVYPFSEPEYWEGVPPFRINNVTLDPEGEVVANAHTKGLYRMVDGVWTPANTEQSEQAQLSMSRYFFDEEGASWAFYGIQVSREDAGDLVEGTIAEVTIRHNFVREVVEGPDGSIYVRSGMRTMDRYQNGQWAPFWTPLDTIASYSSIYDLEVDAGGKFWLATYQGLYSWDGQNWEHQNAGNSDLPFTVLNHLEIGANGQMWVCNSEDVAWFDGQNWVVYTPDNSVLTGNLFKDMVVDQNDVLWITTYQEELFRLDNGQWQLFTHENSIIPDDYWSGDLALDGQNRLWVSLGYNGLLSIEGEDWAIIPPDEISGFGEGLNGYIYSLSFCGDWFCLAGYSSLTLWDGAGNWVYYSEENLPLDGYIFDMLYDSQDRLWLGAQEGLLMQQWQTTDAREPLAAERSIVRVFPNPATDQLSIAWPEATIAGARLELTDASGRQLRALLVPAGVYAYQVSVSDLAPGLYFLQYIDGEKQEVVKWVKR